MAVDLDLAIVTHLIRKNVSPSVAVFIAPFIATLEKGGMHSWSVRFLDGTHQLECSTLNEDARKASEAEMRVGLRMEAKSATNGSLEAQTAAAFMLASWETHAPETETSLTPGIAATELFQAAYGSVAKMILEAKTGDIPYYMRSSALKNAVDETVKLAGRFMVLTNPTFAILQQPQDANHSRASSEVAREFSTQTALLLRGEVREILGEWLIGGMESLQNSLVELEDHLDAARQETAPDAMDAVSQSVYQMIAKVLVLKGAAKSRMALCSGEGWNKVHPQLVSTAEQLEMLANSINSASFVGFVGTHEQLVMLERDLGKAVSSIPDWARGTSQTVSSRRHSLN